MTVPDDIIRLCTVGKVTTIHRISGTTSFVPTLPEIDPDTGKEIAFYELYYTTIYDEDLKPIEYEHKRPVYKENATISHDPHSEFKKMYHLEYPYVSEGKIIISKNGKMGYADLHGNILISPQWQSASQFQNGRAIVNKNKNEYLIIDETGNEITSIQCNGLYSLGYAYSFAIMDNDGKSKKYGLIDNDLNIVSDARYEQINTIAVGIFSDDSRILTVYECKSEGGYGLLSSLGQEILETKYDAIDAISESLVRVQLDDQYGIADITGHILTGIEYPYIGMEHDGMILFKNTDDKYGYMDQTGRIIIQPQYEGADNFNEGIAIVKLNNKYGALNTSGQIIIPFMYDTLRSCHENMLFASKNGRDCYIDAEGNEQFGFPGETQMSSNFSEGLVFVMEDNISRYYDKKGNIIIEVPYQGFRCGEFKNGFAQIGKKVERDNQTVWIYGLIDKTGKIIIEPNYENIIRLDDKLYKVTRYNLSGIYDVEKGLILDLEFSPWEFRPT